jgi:hypothetical protein
MAVELLAEAEGRRPIRYFPRAVSISLSGGDKAVAFIFVSNLVSTTDGTGLFS